MAGRSCSRFRWMYTTGFTPGIIRWPWPVLVSQAVCTKFPFRPSEQDVSVRVGNGKSEEYG